MNISSLVFSTDLAGFIISMAAQSILIFLFGISIINYHAPGGSTKDENWGDMYSLRVPVILIINN